MWIDRRLVAFFERELQDLRCLRAAWRRRMAGNPAQLSVDLSAVSVAVVVARDSVSDFFTTASTSRSGITGDSTTHRHISERWSKKQGVDPLFFCLKAQVLLRRRPTKPRPANPRPNRAIVPGSGTTFMVSSVDVIARVSVYSPCSKAFVTAL